jgi:cytochrome c-type biogenesis protein CcmH
MTWLPILVAVALALAAIAFAAVPLWRGVKRPGWLVLGAALALFLLGIGGGTYWMVGQPYLAMRDAAGLSTQDVNGLVPFLIQRVRKDPGDVTAWRYLGEVYMRAGGAGEAARAYGRAIRLAGMGDASLDVAFGEALTARAAGAVGNEAAAAFQAALRADPKNLAARFYLGLAAAQGGDRAGARARWEAMLADLPPDSPLRAMMTDKLAMLAAGGGGAAPDPRAMVASLAARLKADPHDAPGWTRLIRAYAVLGEMDKAKAALATARKTFADNKDALTAFETEAKALKLD